MERLTRVLAGLLRAAARLLPPGRREWAEAVRAETSEVPGGWPRLRWTAGGLRLVAREANVVRKAVYWIGLGAVAAAAAWAIWLTWRASSSVHPQAVTNRVRVLVGMAALVVLPWVGRRRGWFGPVGASITARVVRLGGCAAICGLGMAVVRFDSYLSPGPHGPGPFSPVREIAGLVLLGGGAAALSAVKVKRPDMPGDEMAFLAVAVGAVVLVILPLQMLAIAYAAGILAVTSRRSPVPAASLAAGTLTGLVAGLVICAVMPALRDLDQLYPAFLIMAVMVSLLLTPAGVAAAWSLPGTGDPQELRAARIRQGRLAGVIAGAVCGVLLTVLFPLAVFVMVIGPLFGALFGAFGGAVAADHPRRPRPDGSWAGGLFALSRTR
jgi:tetrahydromethanopterin S-methyltransferase subunit G